MIKGKRVLLRPVKKEDMPVQDEFYQNIEIFTLNASLPRVFSIQSTEEWFETCTKRNENAQFLAIETDGQYIGFCSLKNSKIDTNNYWYGIVIGNSNYWEKGFGTEVTKLMIDFAFQYLGARRIGLGTNSKNPRAIKCFESCGFIEEGRIRQQYWINGSYADSVQMGILRKEWSN